MPNAMPEYAADDFDVNRAATPEECDLVLKGGVTSGVVYPYAILEVARKYRLRSIGGASAGAIAAGFAAAAEYARREGDPGGFVRLGTRCATLPGILESLFQPIPKLRPLLRAGLGLTADSSRVRRALWAFKAPLFAGATVGAGVYGLAVGATALFAGPSVWSVGALPGLVIAMAAGAAVNLGLSVAGLVLRDIPANNFGMCPGVSQPGNDGPGITDWFHDAIQEIAFGATSHPRPLTFGDLLGGPGSAYAIDFRAMTTNLSLQRPEVIPRMRMALYFDPAEWSAMFPAAIMDHLLNGTADGAPICPPHARDARLRRLPEAEHLPVLIGIRMSLSFPVLIQAVPLWMEDLGARVRGELATGAALPIVRVWYSDGGLTSNFPVHFFDALLPRRPTFAFSIDSLPDTQNDPERISMPQEADEGVFLPIHKVEGLGGFAGSILASAKDWQDTMQSVLPGQRQRVVRVRLSKTEGGLNLSMRPEVSANLMELGRQAGEAVRANFDFAEHRWRRTLVAYEQLEVLTQSLRASWPAYSGWYGRYAPKSYAAAFPLKKRKMIGERLDGLTACAEVMAPPLDARFPRPTAQLRSTPELGTLD